MTKQEMMERADEGKMMLMVGYDDCIAGIGTRFGDGAYVVYDYKKVIAKLRKEGMSEEEADKWYEYNMVGGWVGEGTPAFIELVGRR